MAGKYGRGHRPDPVGHRMNGFHLLAAALAVAPPISADISASSPPVFDQGQTGSCVGHATCGGAWTSCKQAGHPLPFIPSPDLEYKLARAIDREPGTNGGDPVALTDEGSEPNQAMRAIQEWGVMPMGTKPHDGRNSDVDPSTVNDEPSFLALETAANCELIGAYRINSLGDARILDVCRAIAAGYAVCFAVFVDSTFEAWGEGWTPGKEPLGAPDMNDPTGGGHYIYANRYHFAGGVVTPDDVVIEGPNSWSTEWGNAGYWVGGADFVRAWLGDVYVMAVRKKIPEVT